MHCDKARESVSVSLRTFDESSNFYARKALSEAGGKSRSESVVSCAFKQEDHTDRFSKFKFPRCTLCLILSKTSP